ncbi:sperm acrosome-associated protein 9-like [Anneissia japonica]|uniref:sperm acrosome-associated protein 9-like n=1 Tax=Anneissia japonica TaxID=1529436 RepID=UPI0014259875|nr:sperm acrosome-associated protein 9-like [Anneissia japonica]
MDSCRREVARLKERYRVLQQQQFTFVSAMDNTRPDAFQRAKPVRTINEVSVLHERSKNATDRRAMKQWLDLVTALTNLCRQVELQGQVAVPAERALERWSMLMDKHNDLSNLRAKYPHQEMNHLSCAEARIQYGGVVSLLPIAFEQVDRTVAALAAARPSVSQSSHRDRLVKSASIPKSNTVEFARDRKRPSTASRNGLRSKSCDKMVDTHDLQCHTMKLSLSRLPKGVDPTMLFYRRTLNGRADKYYPTGEITLDKAPWRGASYNNVNHIDHRHFKNLEEKYY